MRVHCGLGERRKQEKKGEKTTYTKMEKDWCMLSLPERK